MTVVKKGIRKGQCCPLYGGYMSFDVKRAFNPTPKEAHTLAMQYKRRGYSFHQAYYFIFGRWPRKI